MEREEGGIEPRMDGMDADGEDGGLMIVDF